MKPKQIHKSTVLGQRGVNLVERVVLEMGHVWNPSTIDAGIDGTIELRGQGGMATNFVILVQVKTTDAPFPSESESSFRWPVDQRDLAYWLGGNAPVLLVVTRPKTDEAYWVSVKSYFEIPERRALRSVQFDKSKDRFDVSAAAQLAGQARPEGLGVYLSPPPKPETLLSNLLEVTEFGPSVQVAATECSTHKEVWQLLRDGQNDPTGEWFLKEGKIFSFLDLDAEPWGSVVDRGTVESIETAHFSRSDSPDLLRDFVRLLNHSLSSRLDQFGVRWNAKHRYYFFLPGRKGGPGRTARYRSLKQSPTREVMWASLLSDEDDPLGLGYPYIRFGRLVEIPIDVSLDEAEWGAQELPAPDNAAEPSFFDE